jgi:cyclic pyranopterin phosphate synthase
MIRPAHPLRLRDSLQRRISYLRLSVTDRCNLRCRYCRPATGLRHAAASALLTPTELETLARVAVALGIRKIRITGGEPLVRPDLVGLVARLRPLPGLDRLALTTNGLRLGAMAGDLRRAGIDTVNISIDSLDPRRYAAVTGGGRLAECLHGVEAALAAGFTTKLNVVVMAGVNDDEIEHYAELAQGWPVAVRFIEHVPVGAAPAGAGLTVPSAQVLERLSRLGTLAPAEEPDARELGGPARMYRLAGACGTVGVIAGVSCRFCADCNRIRITATGRARGCLYQDGTVDLRRHLRRGDESGLAAAMSELVAGKPAGKEPFGLHPGPRPLGVMSRIGG